MSQGSNPRHCVAIEQQVLGKIMAHFGWDQCVCYYRKEGDQGGEGVTHVGFTYRDGKIAEEMARFLANKIFGFAADEEVQKNLDAEIQRARIEMGEGPAADPNAGKRIIMDKIDMTRDEHITKRGPTGKAKKMWDKMGASGGFKDKTP